MSDMEIKWTERLSDKYHVFDPTERKENLEDSAKESTVCVAFSFFSGLLFLS
jgi:hypothetical protein